MIAVALDAILGLVALEALGLVALHRWRGQGPSPRTILFTLAAGFFLMLAVRLAVAAAGDAPIAGCLLAALIAHGLDLATRWGD